MEIRFKEGRIDAITCGNGVTLRTTKLGITSAVHLDREELTKLLDQLDAIRDKLPYTEQQEKRRELTRRLSEDRKKIEYRVNIDLGWDMAMRKLKQLGKALPERKDSDWDMKPGSAPAAFGDAHLEDGSKVHAGASWTREWEVWGFTPEGGYWSHRGRVPSKRVEEKLAALLKIRREKIAGEIGYQEPIA